MARRAASVIGVSIVLAACAHETYQPAPARVEPPAVARTSFDDCELGDGSSVPADFPKGALAPAGPGEHALACGLSGQLAALGEPSLFPLPKTAEVYRVLWIRAGGHPVSVRFERQGTTGQVRGAQTAGNGMGAAGDLLEETTAVPSPELVRDLLVRVEAAGFWTPAPPPGAVPATDPASTWVLEGVRSGEYRVRLFHRETLARDPAVNSLARTLLGASGLHIQGAVY